MALDERTLLMVNAHVVSVVPINIVVSYHNVLYRYCFFQPQVCSSIFYEGGVGVGRVLVLLLVCKLWSRSYVGCRRLSLLIR